MKISIFNTERIRYCDCCDFSQVRVFLVRSPPPALSAVSIFNNAFSTPRRAFSAFPREKIIAGFLSFWTGSEFSSLRAIPHSDVAQLKKGHLRAIGLRARPLLATPTRQKHPPPQSRRVFTQKRPHSYSVIARESLANFQLWITNGGVVQYRSISIVLSRAGKPLQTNINPINVSFHRKQSKFSLKVLYISTLCVSDTHT